MKLRQARKKLDWIELKPPSSRVYASWGAMSVGASWFEIHQIGQQFHWLVENADGAQGVAPTRTAAKAACEANHRARLKGPTNGEA